MGESELAVERSLWQRTGDAIFNKRTAAAAAVLLLAVGEWRGLGRDGDQDAEMQRLGQRLTVAERTAANLQESRERMAALFGPVIPEEIPPELISGVALSHFTQLPGYKDSNYDKALERLPELERSTVQLISRTKGSDGIWELDCTAVKVKVGEQTFITTAEHCIHWAGGPLGPVEPTDEPIHVVNLTQAATKEYAIASIDKPRDERRQPIAHVSGIALSRPHDKYRDRVFMRIAEGADAVYDDIPALPILEMAEDKKLTPEPGEAVTLFSLPSSTQKSVGTTGVYLGRITQSTKDGLVEYDIVGAFPRHEYEEPFYYGGSGSGGILTSGYMLGPLSARNTLTDNNVKGVSRLDQLVLRLRLEQQLKVDTSRFPTIGYYVPNYAWETEELVKDFDRFVVPPYIPRGGVIE